VSAPADRAAPRVLVVGGGLAGIAAALACADAGARVRLLEARPRLGGATCSWERDGLAVDNGQHVFLRCFGAYRGLLRRLGVEELAPLQPRLEIPVLTPGAPPAWIRRGRLPAPAHLAGSLLRYRHLPLRERLRLARSARRLARLDPADQGVDARSLGDWLAAQGESGAAIDAFWELLVRPALNACARDASLALAAFVFREGLLRARDAGDIGVASVPLDRLHAEPAARALAAAGVEVTTRARVEAIEAPAGGAPAARLAGARLAADALIFAGDHEAAARLLPDASGVDRRALARLGRAPIVNLHVVFDRPVLPWRFAAAVRSPLQWIFDRTPAREDPARRPGEGGEQYLAVSLSAAAAWVGRSREELAQVFLPAFAELLPAARGARVQRFFATCERAATFAQRPGTARLRPGARTAHPGIFLAGAWTATGWPATMEGAVRSGLAAARAALLAVGRTARLPAEAGPMNSARLRLAARASGACGPMNSARPARSTSLAFGSLRAPLALAARASGACG
jgi:squalene-associated FAD-dependent desaturase